MPKSIHHAFRLQRAGRLDEAAEAYREILAQRPIHHEAAYRLAMLRFQQDRYVEALECLTLALKARPDHAPTLLNVGIVEAALGRHDEALKAYDRALALDPRRAETLFNRANTLRQLNRPIEAIAEYDRAIAARPDYFDAFVNRGNAQRDIGRLQDAMNSYDKASAIQPRHLGALLNAAAARIDLGRAEDALASYQRAMAIDPSRLEAQLGCANALKLLGRVDEALAAYDLALAQNPDSPDALDGKGMALNEAGRLDEAVVAFRRAIAVSPRRPRYYYNLATSRKLALNDPGVIALTSLEGDLAAFPPEEQIYWRFALANVLADNGETQRSFAHLVEANALKRRSIPYDERASIAALEAIGKGFTADFIRANAGGGCDSPAPIFIVGMPRSGSTLVEQILSSHRKAFGAGEVTDLALSLAEANSRAEVSWDATAPDGFWRHVGARYVERMRRRAPQAERIVDKMLDNFRLIGIIHLALPNARIIHTRREPADTCFSCYSKLFAGHIPYAYDLGELGRYYRAYSKLMDHWRNVLPQGVMIDVQYENLVADLEGQSRRLVAHCGLAWDEHCLEFHRTQRQVRTASMVQVRKPIYASAIGQWRTHAQSLGPLFVALGPGFSPIGNADIAGANGRRGRLTDILRRFARVGALRLGNWRYQP